MASPHRLLDALVEGSEERLTLQYEAGSMHLANQDAAMTHRKRTVAGLNHRTWQGGEGRNIAKLMRMTSLAAKLTLA